MSWIKMIYLEDGYNLWRKGKHPHTNVYEGLYWNFVEETRKSTMLEF